MICRYLTPFQRTQLDKAADAGMTTFMFAAQVAKDADFIVTMLPDGPIVLSVFEQIIPAAKSDAVLIDCSTVDVFKFQKSPYDGSGGYTGQS